MKKIEPGEASLKIKLKNGKISVFEGDDGVLLAQLKKAPEGTWRKIWDGLLLAGLKQS